MGIGRAVANSSFSQLFEYARVENIITTASDHFAILLSLSKQVEKRREARGRHNFKCEAPWYRAADYQETVEKIWAEGSGEPRSLQAAWYNLNKMARSLSVWSRTSFGVPSKEIRKLEKRLSSI